MFYPSDLQQTFDWEPGNMKKNYNYITVKPLYDLCTLILTLTSHADHCLFIRDGPLLFCGEGEGWAISKEKFLHSKNYQKKIVQKELNQEKNQEKNQASDFYYPGPIFDVT